MKCRQKECSVLLNVEWNIDVHHDSVLIVVKTGKKYIGWVEEVLSIKKTELALLLPASKKDQKLQETVRRY